MHSLDLRQILPPKTDIFRSPKSANFVKDFATNPEFRQFRQISSKVNIFVTTATFRHLVSFSSETKSFGAYLDLMDRAQLRAGHTSAQCGHHCDTCD